MSSAKLALLADYRTSDRELRDLEALGFRVFPTDKVTTLYPAVDGHPDLQVFRLEDDLFVHPKISPSLEKELFLWLPVRKGERSLSLPYPRHVAFNALDTGAHFLHRLDATDPRLLEAVKARRREVIPVKQGYTRCSCAQVSDRAFVTEDAGIAKVLTKLHYTVFYRPPSNVVLEGFEHGFLGGALSRIPTADRDLILITGDVHQYAYGRELLEFFALHRIEAACVGTGPLKDRGSLISLCP